MKILHNDKKSLNCLAEDEKVVYLEFLKPIYIFRLRAQFYIILYDPNVSSCATTEIVKSFKIILNNTYNILYSV